MNKICLHCFVEGRVQGVFYRKGAQRKAQELGIMGYARNLSDGRVEVMACGDQDQVEEMRNWLWDGPATADVTDVVVDEADWEEFNTFEVR